MSTKDHSLFFKDKKQDFVFNDNLNGHFNNLNLNQNNQCFAEIFESKNVKNQNKENSNYECLSSEIFDVQGLKNCATFFDGLFFKRTAVLSKLLDNSFNNDSQSKQKNSTLFGRTKMGTSFANLNIQKDYGKKEEKILNAKSSTLSLHISAYENSIDAIFGDPSGEKDGTKKNKENISSIKSLKAVKTSSIVNYAFEFPRQQKDQKNDDPEVMQFKASQQLSNVNGGHSIIIDEDENILMSVGDSTSSAMGSIASVIGDSSSSSSSESELESKKRYSSRKKRRPLPIQRYHQPCYLTRVYEMNYLCNVPIFEDIDDNTMALAFVTITRFKRGISKNKCEKDAIMLSKKVCKEFSTKTIPLLSMHSTEDKRLRVMEEEIRTNLFAFVDLCVDQISAETTIHPYRMKHHEIRTKHGQTLACCNRPVPKFWV